MPFSKIEKRPVSYSESHLYFNKDLPTEIDFHIRSAPLIESGDKTPVSINGDGIEVKPAGYCQLCVDYGLRFIVHIFLISIFESLFFFSYVSKDEDAGILATTNFYTESIINSCTSLNNSESEILNVFLEKFINASEIISLGTGAHERRLALNTRLFNLSWSYTGFLGATFTGLLIFSYMNKFKIRWSHIFLENLAMVVFLGFYEYMFFLTIIKKYSTETPQEISTLFVSGLQQRCGLLT
jgi:hypothetical protein